ncbi:hypothetical protein HN873_064747 [Arachis hypogaea]
MLLHNEAKVSSSSFFSSFSYETFIFLSYSSSLQFLRNSPFPFSSRLQYLGLSNQIIIFNSLCCGIPFFFSLIGTYFTIMFLCKMISGLFRSLDMTFPVIKLNR